MISVLFCILIGSFAVALLPAEWSSIAHGRAAAGKLFATIDRVPIIDSQSSLGLRPPTENVRGLVSFKNVSFNYPSRPSVRVLRDLSVTFEAGKTTAIVGSSGSGKSTVVNLIERFYDTLSGSVTLDGVNVKDLNVIWLRSQIGLVSQEPVLFMASIHSNVAHGLIGSRFEKCTPEEKDRLVKEACLKANADGFIRSLPEGYDTLVGERGFLLSGGQKRAYVRYFIP